MEATHSYLCRELFDFNTSLLSSFEERVCDIIEMRGFQTDVLLANVGADDVLLCDMDGTLIDTDSCNTTSYKAAMEVVLGSSYAELFDEERIERTALYSKLSWISEEQLTQIVALKEKFYAKYIDEVEIIPSTMEILKMFINANKTVLVSNARRSRVMQTLQHLHIEGLFDAIVTKDDCNGSDKFSATISKFHLNPEKVWVFENEEAQAMDAVKAGINVKHIILR